MLPPTSPGIFGSPWPGWLLSGEHRFHLGEGGEERPNTGVGGLQTGLPQGAAPPKTHPAPPGTHAAPRVGLTVQSRHKILQGFAVEGEGSGGVPLLILLHRLHHQLGLGETTGEGGAQGSPPPHPRGAAPQHPAHRLAEALGAGDVLHIHKRVGEEALEGDAFQRVPLQELS